MERWPELDQPHKFKVNPGSRVICWCGAHQRDGIHQSEVELVKPDESQQVHPGHARD